MNIGGIIYFVIAGLLIFAIYGSFNLSRRDYRKKNVCPKVLGIPACYIVLLFFILTFLAHILKGPLSSIWWYYGFLAVPLLLALSGSLAELSGKKICPRTAGGTPMCFISLGFCSTLLILTIIENSIA